MKLPFEKVYCLHLAEAKDRYENIMSEFKRLGIENQVEIWWTGRFPDIFDEKFKNDNFTKGAVGCALNHYLIVKTAYNLGYNNILIFEDDIKFIDDKEKVMNAFNWEKFPTDWDCLKFHYEGGIREESNWKEEDKSIKEISFKDITNEKTWTTICLAYNRRFMEKYIEYMDKHFVFADHIFGCGNDFMIENNLKVYGLSNIIVNAWCFERLITYEQ